MRRASMLALLLAGCIENVTNPPGECDFDAAARPAAEPEPAPVVQAGSAATAADAAVAAPSADASEPAPVADAGGEPRILTCSGYLDSMPASYQVIALEDGRTAVRCIVVVDGVEQFDASEYEPGRNDGHNCILRGWLFRTDGDDAAYASDADDRRVDLDCAGSLG